MEPSTITIGDSESAEVEGGFDPGGGLNLKIATRGLNVDDLRSFGLSAIPLLEQTPQGTLRGWASYKWTPGAPGEWTGEYELQNARIAIDGLADPLRIQSAAVVSNGARISLSRLRAKVGAVAFTGDYRYEPLGGASAQVSHRHSEGGCGGVGADLRAGAGARARISGAHAAIGSGAGAGLVEESASGRNDVDRRAHDRGRYGSARGKRSGVVGWIAGSVRAIECQNGRRHHSMANSR